MRIAQLIPQFYPYIGGAEICIHNISKKLIEKGHFVVLVTTTAPPTEKISFPYKIEYLSTRTCALFRRLPFFIGKSYLHFKLAQLQKKYKFDLWQVTNGWPLGAFAVDFFRKNKIPSVLRCCGDDIQKYPEINYGVRLEKKIDKIIQKKFPLFNKLIALTPTVKMEYLKMGISQEKIVIVPNGVNISKFNTISKEKRDEIRRNFGLKDIEKTLILTVGRYHPKKGFDNIPLIARELKDKGIEFNWLIFGRGTSKIMKNCPDCNRLGIFVKDVTEKFVTNGELFDLPRQDVINAYLSSDIFAFPTLIETFGMVLIEAMAAGLPIVTNKVPGVIDVVENDMEGFLVQSNNNREFANALALLISNNEIYCRLSNQAKESASKYDWSLITDKYIDVYLKTLNI